MKTVVQSKLKVYIKPELKVLEVNTTASGKGRISRFEGGRTGNNPNRGRLS